jgi:hypothetical protein
MLLILMVEILQIKMVIDNYHKIRLCTDEVIELQSGTTQYLTGDGSTVTFNLTTPVLDKTRIAVFLNGVKQPIDEVWTYARCGYF